MITHKIGNGEGTFLWLDNWLPQGPLYDIISPRTIYSTGLALNAKVSDIIENGHWKFPISTPDLTTIWQSISWPPCSSNQDILLWNGSPNFSVKAAWEYIRNRNNTITSHKVIWFSGHIPRHSFILWLAFKNRLGTADRITNRGVTTSGVCVLCKSACETHNHLFFKCPFATQVWEAIAVKTLVCWPSLSLQRIITWASTHLISKDNFQHLIGRLAIAATVYAIWYERNSRIFQNTARPRPKIIKEILNQIRERLLFINSSKKWNLPSHVLSAWDLHPD